MGKGSRKSRRWRAQRRDSVEELESRVLLSFSANYHPVVLDPGNRLAGSQVLGEWATDGNFDGWTVNNAQSAMVAGGLLTLTSQNGTNNPTQIDLTNIGGGNTANEPYLDYGYFDYLQIAIQLPANYSKDVVFSFGTSTHAGVTASDRTFTIPAASIAQDGGMHTYRLDLGLVIWWRDYLHDLRIQPLGTTGANETAVIDYVEVGDQPNDTLLLNTNLNFAAGVTLATAQHVESKHFAVWWDPNVNPGGKTNFDVMAHNALRMMEESYQVYYKWLGFDEPFQTTSHTGPRYKLNLITWYSGYWEGVWANYAHINVDTTGLQDEGPGSPVPHEFGHATQSNQLGNLAGGHWESDANVFREARDDWFAPIFGTSTGISQEITDSWFWSNFRQDSSRMIYNDHRAGITIQDFAESLGLPWDTAARIWKTGSSGQTWWAKLATLLPSLLPGASIKDVAAQLLEHWPLIDLQSWDEQLIKNDLWGTTGNQPNKTKFLYQIGSPLVPESDNPGWFRVPFERAPEKYAFMVHPLTPNAGSTSITVTLRGMNVPVVSDEDWRWSLIFTDGSGNVTRYSPDFAPGTQTLALNPGETKVYLFVLATPGDANLELNNFYNTEPIDKNTNRMRYPYEVQITGATPTVDPLTWTASSYKAPSTNPDGSPRGLIATSATVAATAYVGVNARVLGNAQVLGNAKVMDYAVVTDSAVVRDNAVVAGYALVHNSAVVRDNALVTDHGVIENSAQVQGNAVVEQYARMGDSAILKDSAIARGDSYLWGSANVSGTAIADYDYSMNYTDISDGNQFNHIPFDSYFDPYYAQTQKKPRGLIASYRVSETTGEELQDEFGSLEAWLVGSPTRPTDANFNNSQVLSLNGSSQYAVLDRTLGNLASGTFGMWVNPSSTDADETLLYFGSSPNTYLKLTARDANGFAHLTISVNGTVQQLVSTSAVALNAWTHLAVTFGGGTATFYINGAGAGSGAMTFRPIDVLGADTYSAANGYYLGRDPAGNFFTGKLEDIRFYNVVLTQAEVQNEIARSGARIGELFATTPMDFNGTTTTFESGVHGGDPRTLSAWIYPRSNAATYTAIFDSYDERGSGNNRGSGVGLAGGIIQVRLDGVGLWNTGIAVTLNTWQQIGLTISGGTASLYLNGVLKATHSYTTGVAAAKNYHIGFYQTDDNNPPTRTGFFNGQIYDARIYDSVVVPSGRFDIGPTAVNDAVTVPGGAPSVVNVLANDTDPNPAPLKVSGVTQGAHGTVSITSGATAVTYTPVNGYLGSDSFTYTNTDGFGQSSTATVNITVTVILGSIVITPASPSLNNGDLQTFTATGYDTVGNPMSQQPTFNWSIVSGGGTLIPQGANNGSANFTAGNNTETVTIKANSGTISGTATVSVASSIAPTIVNTPAATPNPNTGSAGLSVLADDAAGEANLTYTWSAAGTPPAPVTFSPSSGPGSNGTNGAKNITATFSKAGSYTLQVQITNPSGNYTIVPLNVQVSQVFTSIGVTPASPTVAANTTDQFTATAYDQFGSAMVLQPAFTWSMASGSGNVSSSGLYSAPRTSGSASVRATSGAISGTGSVTINYEELAWYQADVAGINLLDSSGHNKTAPITGTVNTNYNFPPGVEGGSFHLITAGTPAAEYATLPTGIVNGLNDFTIAVWVKVDALNNWSRIFDFGTGTTANMFLTARAGDTSNPLRFAITTTGSGGEQRINGPTLVTGSWYHIAITLVGNTGTMYVNGIAVASNTSMTIHPSAMGSTNQNYIGKSQYGDPGFQGSIDDFRIFGRGLSAAEISRLAKPTVVTGPAASANPVTTTSTTLSVLGSDITAGEAALTYTWATIGSPPAPVAFSTNGTNAAKNTVATFTKAGTYNFQVTIVNPAAGSTFATTASFSVSVTAGVALRGIFYNDSAFDGGIPAANASDDAAIDSSKQALLPGQSATFANYTSYDKGINGVMVDIANGANIGAIGAGDFTFKVGNSSDPTTWTTAPAPASISVRPGAGSGGSDRVTITWADFAIQDKWLQVTVKSGGNTGLPAADIFYFGNAIGETGNSALDAKVTSADEIAARVHPTNSALVTSPYDFNRDGLVDPTDESIARANVTNVFTALSLIAPPSGLSLVAGPAVVGAGNTVAAQDPVASPPDQNTQIVKPRKHAPPATHKVLRTVFGFNKLGFFYLRRD